MNTRIQCDVIIADDKTPATEPLDEQPTSPPEGVDVATVDGPRVIYLAPTKAIGQQESDQGGLNTVAILTPRTLDAARGIHADLIQASFQLADDQVAELTEHARPSLVS